MGLPMVQGALRTCATVIGDGMAITQYAGVEDERFSQFLPMELIHAPYSSVVADASTRRRPAQSWVMSWTHAAGCRWQVNRPRIPTEIGPRVTRAAVSAHRCSSPAAPREDRERIMSTAGRAAKRPHHQISGSEGQAAPLLRPVKGLCRSAVRLSGLDKEEPFAPGSPRDDLAAGGHDEAGDHWGWFSVIDPEDASDDGSIPSVAGSPPREIHLAHFAAW